MKNGEARREALRWGKNGEALKYAPEQFQGDEEIISKAE